ncbi:unnamed protein product [Penicillium salamii]|nr:unnamed protein product [Penicillium salamii]CAG8358789.1 unnamed protein product [Penicillium salamii]
MLFPITIIYLLWAIFLSETLFHRVWSLTLFSLSCLIDLFFSLPTFSIQLWLLITLNLLIFVALSPLQVFLFPGSVRQKEERLTTFPSGNASQDDFLADIVFVHGLASNPKTATEARSSTKLSWIRDFLPKENINCRIMAFNHDTRFASNALSKSLKDLGDDLIRALRYKRQTEKSVVSIMQGGELRTEFLPKLHGFIFLGTPHKGSRLTPIGEIISLLGYWRGSDTSLLRIVRRGSEVNTQLHEQFKSFLRDTRMFERTVCVFETEKETIWGLSLTHVVERDSAVIDLVENFSSETRHRDIQRYSSKDDETYQDIVTWIQKWLQVESKRRTATQTKLKRIYSVPIETVSSYTQRDHLYKDLEEKLRVRHGEASIPYAVALHGLGGVGKSQLALKYAESQKDRFDPILWIDATNEELLRSSFTRCAAELGLLEDQNPPPRSALIDDWIIQRVRRWLCDQTESDSEWLVIIDNADDFGWGIENIIPKGARGSLLITSQDKTSRKLVKRGCEEIEVSVMLPIEARAVLLRHLSDDPDSLPEKVHQECDKVANTLGYLALAIDLAGAFIGNDSAPEDALMQYIKDYDKNCNTLLKINRFQGLSSSQKTVWTVWNTTLQKIESEYPEYQPGLLLTFLAHFKGPIVENEMFHLASRGMPIIEKLLGKELSTELRQFISVDQDGWADFQYRQSLNALVRYGLVQRVMGEWPGTTMHKLVQWRAMQNQHDRPWQFWYTVFVLAACSEITEQPYQPEFRRHLMVHLPNVGETDFDESTHFAGHEDLLWSIIGRVYQEEGRWTDASNLQSQAMEDRKTKLGTEHPDTLKIMASLGMTLQGQGRYDEAEELQAQVMEIRKTKLGAEDPDTLEIMASLAMTLWEKGRYNEAEELQAQVMEIRKTKSGAKHIDTLKIMAELALTLLEQGRWKEAEALQVQVVEHLKSTLGMDHPMTLAITTQLSFTHQRQGRSDGIEQLHSQVMETSKMKLGTDHHLTLDSMAMLAVTYYNQRRYDEAAQLDFQITEMCKTNFGIDHPRTLFSMTALASTLSKQGRYEEAEQLEMQAMEMYKKKLGTDNPDTLLTMNNLALTYHAQRRWKEAEQLLKQVIKTRKITLGARHPDTLESMANLARMYCDICRWEEAENLQIQVVETSQTLFGNDDQITIDRVSRLASIYRNQSRWEDAGKFELQVMEASKLKFGENHPDTLKSMANLAFTWKSQGRDADALDLLDKCYQIRNPHLATKQRDSSP